MNISDNTGLDTYQYQVIVSETSGNCPVTSTPVTLTVTPYQTTTVSCGTSTQSSVTFDWTTVTGATGYDLSYTINGGAAQTVNNVNAITYQVTGLNQGDIVDITVTPLGTGCYTPANGSCTAETCSQAIANFNFNPTKLTNSNPTCSFINLSSNANSFYWDFGDGTTSNDSTPTHTFTIDGDAEFNILLIAQNDSNCNDTIIKKIKVEEEFIYYVPNTFTPDGDKFNNEFKPVFHSGYDSQNYTMYIFDRWGELVFETHDINEGWKGLYGTNGVIAQDGIYTWKIECKHRLTDDIEIAMGSLNLLR